MVHCEQLSCKRPFLLCLTSDFAVMYAPKLANKEGSQLPRKLKAPQTPLYSNAKPLCQTTELNIKIIILHLMIEQTVQGPA